MKSFPTLRSVRAALNAVGPRFAAQMWDYLNAFCRQSTKDGYNTTEAKNDALTDLMAARTAEDDELVDDLTYFEIEDAPISYANAIIVMILFGLIGTDVNEKISKLIITTHYNRFQTSRKVNSMLIIDRMQKDTNKSKRDLMVNLFYSGVYLPLSYWSTQTHGNDSFCRIKHFLSMSLITLTHIIVLDHLGVKFVETLKSLNSLESKGSHSC